MYYSLSIVGIPAERAREIIPGILELTEGTGVQLQTREVKETEKKQEAPLFKYRAEEHQQPEEATKEEPAAEHQAQPEAPAEAAAAPQVSRKEAKSAAVKKIQEGHKDEVKALVTKYAATGKVDDIPEEQLGAFVAGLAEIGA